MFIVKDLLRFTPWWCILNKGHNDICWQIVNFKQLPKLNLLQFIELKLNINEILPLISIV